MRLPRSFTSGAFRFAFVMALVFGTGAMALLVGVKHAIDHYTADAVADAVSSEVAILRGEERQLGRAELVGAVNRHERAVRERQLRYLLQMPDGTRAAGTLPATFGRTGWHAWRLRECGDPTRCVTPLLAEGVTLADGAILVVASDTTDLVRLQTQLSRATEEFGTAVILFVLLGGLATGGVFLRRLDRVNASIDRIVAGRFAERLPRIGMGPEFNHLSSNLNAMLDRIELLMDGLRQVSIDIAHDLRTPLTRLRQRLERLQADAPADFAVEMESALAQTDQILGIFTALLRIGAMESGAARALFAPIDLSELLGLIADAYAPEIEDGGRHLATSLPPDMIVRGDAELLGQAVANLLENSIAHTPPGSRVALTLARADGAIAITVADNGPGVPAEERTHVLRRFYRLDRSRSTPGAGLGLPLAAAVATLHDGTLSLEDAAPGLRVTIRLAAL
jgi:signal transduction histidine kinase